MGRFVPLPRMEDKFIPSLKSNAYTYKENVSGSVSEACSGDDIDLALKGGPHDWRILIARVSVRATPKVFPSCSIDANPKNEH